MRTPHFFIFSFLLLASCQSTIDKAVRETKYSAYEMVGVEKRDLLKKYVKTTKETQQETQEAFTDALDQLKKTYSFDGAELERQYGTLKSSYEQAEKRSGEVHKDIEKVQKVADDLFTEWQKEIGQMTTPALKSKSQEQLSETKKRFSTLRSSLLKSEAKIAPILTRLKDHVLFMKHNLNAKAIGSLKKETVRIENDISALIESMKVSIRESDEFVQQL